MSIPWPSCPLNISVTVFQTARQIEISSLLRVHIFISVPEFLPPYFFCSRAFPEWPRCCISTAALYWIIMKLKTPEKFQKLLPKDYWLLVPWRFYAWHPHHTSRDRSRFLRMMLFINNTKSTFYETKILKTKHVSFLKYIYKLIMLYWFSTGHSDQCHWEIYRSLTGANFDHC